MGRHQQARLRPGFFLALQNQQERKNLDGLAQPHVVRQTRPQAELCSSVNVCDPHLLVGPQHALERMAGVDGGQSPWAAQPVQGLSQPGARGHFRPIGAGCCIRVRDADVRAGQQPHGLAEGHSGVLRRPFHFAEALDHALQVLAVDLDPAPAHQRESVCLRQQVADFRRGERFAIQRDFHAEIEQRVLAQPRGRPGPHGAGHPRPRRTIAPPRRRHANHHARVAAGRAPVQGCAGGFEAGVQAVSSLPKEGLRHVLVLAPGNYMNGGDLVRGINSVLPACVTASGGFAGAGGSVHGSSVWCGGPPERSAVVVLGLYGARLKVGTGSGGGWRPFGPDRRITRSFKETIYEFDRRPALELYKQYLGEYAQGLPFTALRFPLGLRTCESEPWQVRVINGIDEPNGGLAFDCSIPEGAHARFLVCNAEHLVEGARAAAQLVRQELGVPAQLSIVVSCYGRRVVLGQRTEEELETVRDALDGRTVLTGFYSYGEISRHAAGTQAELYNQTMTLTGFAEV